MISGRFAGRMCRTDPAKRPTLVFLPLAFEGMFAVWAKCFHKFEATVSRKSSLL